MKEKKLLVVGELNVDLILNNIQGFPKMGDEIIANQLNLTLGSSSAIFASNIAVLGVNTSFCGMVGADYFGDFIKTSLEDKEVSTIYLRKLENKQSGITVVMNYGQDRANVTYCGAMDQLTIDDIPWYDIHKFDHLHFSSLFIQKSIRKDIVALFRRAKEAGLSTSLDLQTDPEGIFDFDFEACLPFVDIFLPNKAELLGLTKAKSLEQALAIINPHVNTMALKIGEKGSILINEGIKHESPAFTHNAFVDAIGAGDSFNAGFISYFLQGEKLEDCLQFGNLIGAINTSAAGGTGAFGNSNQVSMAAKKIFNYDLFHHEFKK